MAFSPGHPLSAERMLLHAVRLTLRVAGREVVIEAMRLGCETVAVDSYVGAPAMGLAHRSFAIDMTDADALRRSQDPYIRSFLS